MDISFILLILYYVALFFFVLSYQKSVNKYKREIELRKKMIENRDKFINNQNKEKVHLKFQLSLLQDIKIVLNSKGTLVDKYDKIKELVDKSN